MGQSSAFRGADSGGDERRAQGEAAHKSENNRCETPEAMREKARAGGGAGLVAGRRGLRAHRQSVPAQKNGEAEVGKAVDERVAARLKLERETQQPGEAGEGQVTSQTAAQKLREQRAGAARRPLFGGQHGHQNGTARGQTDRPGGNAEQESFRHEGG